jgi:outer membrane protein insertion porin family
LFESIGTGNLLNYVSNGGGFTTFISSPWKRTFARVGVTYGYSRQNIRTSNDATTQYFEFINFQGLDGQNQLSGIRSSAITPNYSYNSVDHPITPSRGRSLFISTQFAGIGGNVRMVEPTVDAKYFRRGFKQGHVIGMHALGRFVTGYGDRVAPPFNRFYMGGENDIRGFDIWQISPVAYVPTAAQVPVLNADGSARQQRIVLPDGTSEFQTIFQQAPAYQLIFPGGDTQFVGNFEYRVPIAGPVWLAYFFDAGVNRISRPSQLRLNPGRLAELNAQFPQAAFEQNAVVAPATQKWRSSTGLEVQILMPVVNAPFRLYWAYNPTILQDFLLPPLVLDRSYFPNNATFLQAVTQFGLPTPFFERKRTFRFTISRTF